MYAALKLRIDTANGIFSGTMKVETALQKLRTEASPSGLMLEPDADFAYAAIDLGQRLIASGRPDEAGKFFTEAEKADVPGRVPGSFATYEKQIDSAGTTIQFTKTTVDPAGKIVHVKSKMGPAQ